MARARYKGLNRAMAGFPEFCSTHILAAKAAGWTVLAERKLEYGRQFELADSGGAKASLSCYHGKRGFSFVVGGKQGAALATILGGGLQQNPATGSQLDPFSLGFPHIGCDESGKGDFFGPLVVAAFFVEEGHAKALIEMGVADCKTLSNAAVERLAGLLEPGTPTKAGLGHAVALMPAEYNHRYSRLGNLNVLLAQLHGECVNALLAQLAQSNATRPRAVLVDQFASNPAALKGAMKLREDCKLVTRTGGELDVACAAASVLARAEFLRALRDLGGEYGQDLPPGAGPQVIKAGREFKRAFGAGELAKVGKTHFKTMESL